MKNNIFNKEYNVYWKNRVNISIDGSKVPGDDVISELVKELDIQKNDRVLDMGCGYGRLFIELRKYSKKIFGFDIDMSMVNDATKYNYESLHCASTEDTKYPDNYFDKIMSIGVFDVVDQEKSLFEVNRILKTGGLCLFTGKNINYFDDDSNAFVAEKNAKLKDFPNHFTDVNLLVDNLLYFGFSFENLFIFQYRGDFGNNKKIRLKDVNNHCFYEYCITIKKVISIAEKPSIIIASEFSDTAKRKAVNFGESNILDFFKI